MYKAFGNISKYATILSVGVGLGVGHIMAQENPLQPPLKDTTVAESSHTGDYLKDAIAKLESKDLTTFSFHITGENCAEMKGEGEMLYIKHKKGASFTGFILYDEVGNETFRLNKFGVGFVGRHWMDNMIVRDPETGKKEKYGMGGKKITPEIRSKSEKLFKCASDILESIAIEIDPST
jgi:hypothetical protein